MQIVYYTLFLLLLTLFVSYQVGGLFPEPISDGDIYLWFLVAVLVTFLLTKTAWIRFRYDLHKIPLTQDKYTQKDFPKLTPFDLAYENSRHAPRVNPAVTLKKGPVPIVIVQDYALFHSVEVSGINSYKPGYKFMRSPFITKIYSIAFGGSTVADAHGEAWKWRRAALGPHFQARNIIPTLLPYIVEKGTCILQHFEATLGEHVEVDEMFTNVTLDIIFKHITGENRADVDRVIHQRSIQSTTFRDMYSALSYLKLPILLFGRGFKMFLPSKSRKAANYLYSYCGKVIDYISAKYRLLDDSQYIPPLARLSKIGNYSWNNTMGKKNLTSDMNIMLFAGHDTTAHTLSFMLYEIARNPSVQARLFKEIRQTFGPPSSAQITPETVANLPVLSAIIRETLRYDTLVPYLIAETAADTVLGGFRLPAGTLIQTNNVGMCYDPRYFDDPDCFNIDRWLESDNKEYYEDSKADPSLVKRNPDVSFNLGTHACLGRNLALLELRVLAAMIVNSYEVSVAKYFELKLDRTSLLRPANGMYMSFKKRKTP